MRAIVCVTPLYTSWGIFSPLGGGRGLADWMVARPERWWKEMRETEDGRRTKKKGIHHTALHAIEGSRNCLSLLLTEDAVHNEEKDEMHSSSRMLTHRYHNGKNEVLTMLRCVVWCSSPTKTGQGPVHFDLFYFSKWPSLFLSGKGR